MFILACPCTEFIQENSLLHCKTQYTKFNFFKLVCALRVSVTLYVISGIKSAFLIFSCVKCVMGAGTNYGSECIDLINTRVVQSKPLLILS